jgi:hypothetical protein
MQTMTQEETNQIILEHNGCYKENGAENWINCMECYYNTLIDTTQGATPTLCKKTAYKMAIESEKIKRIKEILS